MSSYKTINGVKMEKKLLDLADECVGDRRVSYADARLLWTNACYGPGVTPVERGTLAHILATYKCTAAGRKFLTSMMADVVSDTSYYKQVEGTKYVRALLDKAETLAIYGKLDKTDALALWELGMNGCGNVTETEKKTVEFIMKNHTLTSGAKAFFKEKLSTMNTKTSKSPQKGSKSESPKTAKTAEKRSSSSSTPSVMLITNLTQCQNALSEIRAAVKRFENVGMGIEEKDDEDNERVKKKCVVAFSCAGVDLSAIEGGELCLLQLAVATTSYVFDILSLRGVPCGLKTLLEDVSTIKLVHDVYDDAAALYAQHKVRICGTFDTQLAFEVCHPKELWSSLGDALREFAKDDYSSSTHSNISWAKTANTQDPDIYRRRPLSPKLLECSVSEVKLLLECQEKLRAALRGSRWSLVCCASALRCNLAWSRTNLTTHGKKVAFFRPTPKTFALGSWELIASEGQERSTPRRQLRVSNELDKLIQLLPTRFLEDGVFGDGEPVFKVRDIVMDVGRRPYAFFGHDRVFLSKATSDMVKMSDLETVVERIGIDNFGQDNRAGIDNCLHRISAMRDLKLRIYGLTMRVGRAVTGNADMITDLVLSENESRSGEVNGVSLLIMGVPGTGKTTIVREVSRLLAERVNVVVVDTSNEICGDGMIPHASLGLARRMMVPSIEHQSRVMLECLQNHTPDVIVVDEIGRKTEVQAAHTVRQRGVRLVASAHGDLRSLVKNGQLNGLVGGVQTVTLGDAAAKSSKGRKLQAQRMGTPVFDAIVELKKGELHTWRVVTNVAKAVDLILQGQNYPAQLRSRDEEGSIGLKLVSV